MAEAQLAVGVQEGGEIIVIPPARREDLLAQWGIALMVTVLLCLSLSLKSHVLDNAPLSIAYPALMLSYVLFGFLREMFSTEEVRVDHYTIEIERREVGRSSGDRRRAAFCLMRGRIRFPLGLASTANTPRSSFP